MADITSTPQAVSHRDDGRLSAGISASDTTITVGAIFKYVNGVKTKQGFDTTGGFAEISQADRTELISFGAASVDATTKITTLTDVRRGLSLTSTTQSLAAGTGLAWAKGARIAVVASANYYQVGMFTDVVNTLSGGGAVRSSSTTTPIIRINNVTEAQRDAMSASNGDVVYNTDTNLINQYIGGAWAAVGDTGTADSSTTVAGKVEIATDAEIRAETGAGGSGALTVIPASATSVLKDDRMVLKDATELTIATGAVTVTQPYHSVDTESDASTDDLDTITAAVGAGELIVLFANNTARTVVVKHGTGNITLSDASDFELDDTEKSITLLYDGTNWREIARGAGTSASDVQVALITTAAGTLAGASSTAEANLDDNYTVTADTLAAGDTYEIIVQGNYRLDSGNLNIRVKLGSVDLGRFLIGVATTTADVSFHAQAFLVAQTIGPSGTIRALGHFVSGTDQKPMVDESDSAIPPIAQTVDTTTNQTLQLSAQFSVSDADHQVQINNIIIKKLNA